MRTLFTLMILLTIYHGKGECQSDLTPIVTFRRTGGIGGLSDKLDIDKNGQVVLKRRQGYQRFNLDPRSLVRLNKMIDSLDTIVSPVFPIEKQADMIEYELVIGDRKIRMTRGSIAKEYEPIMIMLNKIITEHDN